MDVCCYCGDAAATTRDHIPPKAIFNKPRPSDLITVPCCFKCNNRASRDDEQFKAYLGMHVAHKSEESEQLFKKGVLPTVRHNHSLRRAILKSMKPVNLFSRSGIYLGRGASVPWNNIAHDNTIERLVRGLFYHHSGIVIGGNAQIDTYYFKEPPTPTTDLFDTVSIANGNFIYSYGIAEDSIYNSIWMFSFYDSHWAGGTVKDIDVCLSESA